MIAHLSGTIAEKIVNSIILDVNGVGYEINLTRTDFDDTQVDKKEKYYTYHSVRESSEELFGFSTLMAKKIFELLITVQGVGPKAAMNILSIDSFESVRNAIANADAGFVAKAVGVGKKTAERVVLDLKDKVGAPAIYGRIETAHNESNLEHDEALDALIALGFSLKEATNLLSGIDTSLSTAARVAQALKSR